MNPLNCSHGQSSVVSYREWAAIARVLSPIVRGQSVAGQMYVRQHIVVIMVECYVARHQ